MVRFIDCWFNRLLNILEGYGGLTTLVHISNKIQKETENLSLRYDELGVGSHHQGNGMSENKLNNHYCNTSFEVLYN